MLWGFKHQGYIPASGERRSESERWTGMLSQTLGDGFYVYKNAISGRTTVFDDPQWELANGRKALGYALAVADAVKELFACEQ